MYDKVSVWLAKGDKKPRSFTRKEIIDHHTTLKACISRMSILMFVDEAKHELGWGEAEMNAFNEHLGEWSDEFNEKAESYVGRCHEETSKYLGEEAFSEISHWVNTHPDNATRVFTKGQIRKNDNLLMAYGSKMIVIMLTEKIKAEYNLKDYQLKEFKRTMTRWSEAWLEKNLDHFTMKEIAKAETEFNVYGW